MDWHEDCFESGHEILDLLSSRRGKMITKERLTKLIVEHVFDDGTGSERTPFTFKQFDITARRYHPRYDRWYVDVYDRRNDLHCSNIPIEDLIA
jgi:hypothetical protein